MIETLDAAACPALAARLVSVAPAGLHDVVGRRIFDTLGAVAAGSAVSDSTVLHALDAADGGDGGVVGRVRRLCAVARSSEIDDIDRRSCTTPGAVVVPVVLALGAARRAPAERLSAAIIAGYEAMIWLGQAIDGPQALYRGVWPTYLAAPFAAAAAAGTILGLDETAMTDALAIAAARCAGHAGRPDRHPTSRWLLCGCAAGDGVLAALAAEAGAAGDGRILEGPLGSTIGFDGRALPRGAEDGEPLITRVDVKPFCTARQTQSAVEAAQAAHRELGGRPLRAIEVGVPAAYRAMIDRPQPGDRLSTIVSAQFQIAAALTAEDLLYDVARRDPDPSGAMRETMQQVSVVEDPGLTGFYPASWPARARLRARGGRDVTRVVLDPAGATERPPGWEDLLRKHERIGAWPADRLAAAAERCRRLTRDPTITASELLDPVVNVPRKEGVRT